MICVFNKWHVCAYFVARVQESPLFVDPEKTLLAVAAARVAGLLEELPQRAEEPARTREARDAKYAICA